MTTAHLILRWIHISTGSLAILAGAASMTVSKGTVRHRRAGLVFFGSMIVMGLTGSIIALFMSNAIGNSSGGLVSVYMTGTAWLTVWRKPGTLGRLEKAGAVLGLATAALEFTWAYLAITSPTHAFGGYRATLYEVFGSIILLCALGDLRMIERGGYRGAQRTTRHLWRMCFAMFIASGSFFLGQAKFLPLWMREARLNTVPILLIAIALLYWLVRIRVWPWLRRSATGTRLSAHRA